MTQAIRKRATLHYRHVQGGDFTDRKETLESISAELGDCVYFIHTKDHLIKIGFTTNLNDRHRKFGRWDRLLLAYPGTYVDEQVLHARFRPFLARGDEYYKPARSILEYINERRREIGVSELNLPPKQEAA